MFLIRSNLFSLNKQIKWEKKLPEINDSPEQVQMSQRWGWGPQGLHMWVLRISSRFCPRADEAGPEEEADEGRTVRGPSVRFGLHRRYWPPFLLLPCVPATWLHPSPLSRGCQDFCSCSLTLGLAMWPALAMRVRWKGQCVRFKLRPQGALHVSAVAGRRTPSR